MKYGMPSAKYKVGIHHQEFMLFLVFIFQGRSRIIMFKYFGIGIPLGSHDSCADLAKAGSMSPSFTFQYDVVTLIDDVEGGALQMAFREYPSDFQFLSYNQCLL